MQSPVEAISSAIIPALLVLVLVYGLYKRVDVYDAFVTGAAEGLPVLLRILPYLAGMLMAIRVLQGSGALDFITRLFTPACSAVGFDARLLPFVLIRPLSGSGALAVLSSLFDAYGVDTLVCYTASILMGSTETIFYEIALYFGSVNIKKTRYTIPVALISNLVGIAVGVLVAKLTYR